MGQSGSTNTVDGKTSTLQVQCYITDEVQWMRNTPLCDIPEETRKARSRYLKRNFDFGNNRPEFFPLDVDVENYIEEFNDKPPATFSLTCVFTPDTTADEKRIAAGAEYVSLIRTHSPEVFAPGIVVDQETKQRFVWLEAMNFDYKTHSFSMDYPAGRRNRLFAGVYIYRKHDNVVDVNPGDYKTHWEFFGEHMQLKDNKYTLEYLRITGADLHIEACYNTYNHVRLYVTPGVIESDMHGDRVRYTCDDEKYTFSYIYYIHGIQFRIWKDSEGIWASICSSCDDHPEEFTRLYVEGDTKTTDKETQMFTFLGMKENQWFNHAILDEYMQRQIATTKTYKKLI